MNHTTVLKRAWHVLWHYRALWILGIVLALTTSSWQAASLYDLNRDERERQGLTVTRREGETFLQALSRTIGEEVDQANRELDRFFAEVFHIRVRSNVLLFAAMLVIALTIVYVIVKVARYVSEVALIRMVHDYETTGERTGLWKGLRMGWSQSAWRLFLIDLLIDILWVLAAILLFGLVFGPLPLWVGAGEMIVVFGALLTTGMFFVALVTVIVGGLALSVIRRLSRRACTLDGLGVLASIGRGAAIARAHLKDTALVWLTTTAVRWGWGLVMVPIALLLVGLGVLVGGLPGLLVGETASAIFQGDAPVFMALAVGISLFILTLIVPLLLLAGLREVFVSSTWTLAYRELRPMESPQARQLSGAQGTERRASGLTAAPLTS